MTRLRRLAKAARGAGFPHAFQGLSEGALPLFKVSDFSLPRNERELRSCTNWVSKDVASTLGAIPVPSGSVLLPKIGAALLGNARRITTQPSLFDNNVMAVVPRTAESRYIHYWLSTVDMRQLANPGPVPSLSESAVLDLNVPIVERSQQRAIADFLDRETARIDALIKKKCTLTERIVERRQTLIDKLIGTTGKEMRVRHLTSRLTSGPRGWARYISEQGRLFLRIANIHRRDVELDLSQPLYVDPPETAEARRTRVQLGDVLVSITADIGSVGVARSGHAGAYVSQHIALLTPEGCTTDWLAYSLSTSLAHYQLDSARYGGTKTQLALDDVANVVIRVPARSEQTERLQRLGVLLARQRQAARGLARQIGLLREHRQALITAAVTGRMDIPSAA